MPSNEFLAFDRSAANILVKNLILTQFYSKNGPPKSAPKFCAIFVFLFPSNLLLFPKRAQKTLLCF